MTKLRRLFRVWVRHNDDEGERVLSVVATDEHAVMKQLASEGATVVEIKEQ